MMSCWQRQHSTSASCALAALLSACQFVQHASLEGIHYSPFALLSSETPYLASMPTACPEQLLGNTNPLLGQQFSTDATSSSGSQEAQQPADVAAAGQEALKRRTGMFRAGSAECRIAGRSFQSPAGTTHRVASVIQQQQQQIGMWGPAAAKAAGRLGKAGQSQQCSADDGCAWDSKTTGVRCSNELVGQSSRQGQATMDREHPAVSKEQKMDELARLHQSYGSVLKVFEELLVSERRAR